MLASVDCLRNGTNCQPKVVLLHAIFIVNFREEKRFSFTELSCFGVRVVLN
jgi:hypothetical protein